MSVLEDWIFHVSQVAVYLDLLISEGLGVALSSQPPPPLLPPCQVAPWGKLRCLLDLPSLMFLIPQLPEGPSSPWRLLFSTQLHGESFSRVVGNCQHKGPSLLLVRDTKGHVFGGFASHSWDVKPQFQGKDRRGSSVWIAGRFFMAYNLLSLPFFLYRRLQVLPFLSVPKSKGVHLYRI